MTHNFQQTKYGSWNDIVPQKQKWNLENKNKVVEEGYKQEAFRKPGMLSTRSIALNRSIPGIGGSEQFVRKLVLEVFICGPEKEQGVQSSSWFQ